MAAMLEVPSFHPTSTQFADLPAYIETIREEGQKYGLAKIIPPKGWKARHDRYSQLRVTIRSPIQQVATMRSREGVYSYRLLSKGNLDYDDFKALARKKKYKPPTGDAAEVEKVYWSGLTKGGAPMYGADGLGTLFDEECKAGNLNKLSTTDLLGQLGSSLRGVTLPYLYVGLWRSTFCWHTEDMELFSINYVHVGANKHWYGVPPKHRVRMEALMKKALPNEYFECDQYQRHKTTMIHPSLLLKNGIAVSHAVQRAGEYMVTFPSSFHAGFNAGLNVAEAVNFATCSWIPFGLSCKYCKCKHDTVRIDVPAIASSPHAYAAMWRERWRGREGREGDSKKKEKRPKQGGKSSGEVMLASVDATEKEKKEAQCSQDVTHTYKRERAIIGVVQTSASVTAKEEKRGRKRKVSSSSVSATQRGGAERQKEGGLEVRNEVEGGEEEEEGGGGGGGGGEIEERKGEWKEGVESKGDNVEVDVVKFALQSGGGKKGEEDEVEWAQCEICGSWREVPAGLPLCCDLRRDPDKVTFVCADIPGLNCDIQFGGMSDEEIEEAEVNGKEQKKVGGRGKVYSIPEQDRSIQVEPCPPEVYPSDDELHDAIACESDDEYVRKARQQRKKGSEKGASLKKRGTK